MWRALKAEIVYFLPWLLGGLGIAAFVIVVLGVVMWVYPDDGPPSFLVAIFPIIAGMVVAFIAQSYRVEERRARLLLAGPLTPRQLAWVTVLLPACFVGLGVVAAAFMIGLTALVFGKFEPATMRIVGGFAAQFLAYAQMGPLAQESTAARRQQRVGAAVAGWAVFAGAILALAAGQFFLNSLQGHVGIWMITVITMIVAAALYQGRTDFTR